MKKRPERSVRVIPSFLVHFLFSRGKFFRNGFFFNRCYAAGATLSGAAPSEAASWTLPFTAACAVNRSDPLRLRRPRPEAGAALQLLAAEGGMGRAAAAAGRALAAAGPHDFIIDLFHSVARTFLLSPLRRCYSTRRSSASTHSCAAPRARPAAPPPAVSGTAPTRSRTARCKGGAARAAALERWPVPLGSRWRVAPTGLALRGMSRTRPGHVRDLSFRRVAPTGLALRRPSTRRTRQGGPPAGSRCPSLRRSPRTRSRSISRRCEGRRPSR